MAVQVLESQAPMSSTNFVIGVIDDCDKSERAVLSLMEGGLPSKNVRMFHGHHMPEHIDSTRGRLGQLTLTLGYLQELLSVEGFMLGEYEAHWNAGRHVLLIDVPEMTRSRSSPRPWPAGRPIPSGFWGAGT